jgi:hypothetical protein
MLSILPTIVAGAWHYLYPKRAAILDGDQRILLPRCIPAILNYAGLFQYSKCTADCFILSH